MDWWVDRWWTVSGRFGRCFVGYTGLSCSCASFVQRFRFVGWWRSCLLDFHLDQARSCQVELSYQWWTFSSESYCLWLTSVFRRSRCLLGRGPRSWSDPQYQHWLSSSVSESWSRNRRSTLWCNYSGFQILWTSLYGQYCFFLFHLRTCNRERKSICSFDQVNKALCGSNCCFCVGWFHSIGLHSRTWRHFFSSCVHGNHRIREPDYLGDKSSAASLCNKSLDEATSMDLAIFCSSLLRCSRIYNFHSQLHQGSAWAQFWKWMSLWASLLPCCFSTEENQLLLVSWMKHLILLDELWRWGRWFTSCYRNLYHSLLLSETLTSKLHLPFLYQSHSFILLSTDCLIHHQCWHSFRYWWLPLSPPHFAPFAQHQFWYHPLAHYLLSWAHNRASFQLYRTTSHICIYGWGALVHTFFVSGRDNLPNHSGYMAENMQSMWCRSHAWIRSRNSGYWDQRHVIAHCHTRNMEYCPHQIHNQVRILLHVYIACSYNSKPSHQLFPIHLFHPLYSAWWSIQMASFQSESKTHLSTSSWYWIYTAFLWQYFELKSKTIENIQWNWSQNSHNSCIRIHQLSQLRGDYLTRTWNWRR